jgi:rubrerythrin
VVRILELCRDIELNIAEIYLFFSAIFSENAEITALWLKTYNEEINHSNQFMLAINMRKENIIEGVNIDLYTAQSVLKMVQSIYDSVRKNRPTVADALRSAIKLEEKLADLHMQTVSKFTDDSFKSMFTAMMLADQNHVESLREAYRKIRNTDN